MTQHMDIALFGPSLISRYRNRSAVYFRSLIRALHDRGHRVSFYEPLAFDRQKHRDIDDPPYARSIVYPPTLNNVRKTLAQARGADVVIKTSGIGVFDVFLEEEVLKFQQDGSQIVFWDLDPPATLHSVRNNPHDLFHALIPEYDFVLTRGGGDEVISAYDGLGAALCVPIHDALDPGSFFPVKSLEQRLADLSYFGDFTKTAEEKLIAWFIKPASLLRHRHFRLGGDGWDRDFAAMENISRFNPADPAGINAFLASSQAVLSFGRGDVSNPGCFPTPELFAVGGAARCLITDPQPGIEAFLAPGSECIVASSGEEVAATLVSMTFEDADAIGAAARKHLLTEHCFSHRAAQLDSLLLAGTPAKHPAPPES